MSPEIRHLYKCSRKNETFLKDVYEADGDVKPSRFFASSFEEHAFALLYYGWLVGRYGNDWKSKIDSI